jgi:multisubunit Na+/H+ antiporter MnhG subunit
VNIRIIVAFRVVFLSCFGLDWMRNLHNEHHLAAKSGTVSASFELIGRLYQKEVLEAVVFLNFPDISAIIK